MENSRRPKNERWRKQSTGLRASGNYVLAPHLLIPPPPQFGGRGPTETQAPASWKGGADSQSTPMTDGGIDVKYLSDEPEDYHSNRGEKANDFSGERAAWNRHSERLARWVMERMVVRPDAYLT